MYSLLSKTTDRLLLHSWPLMISYLSTQMSLSIALFLRRVPWLYLVVGFHIWVLLSSIHALMKTIKGLFLKINLFPVKMPLIHLAG